MRFGNPFSGSTQQASKWSAAPLVDVTVPAGGIVNTDPIDVSAYDALHIYQAASISVVPQQTLVQFVWLDPSGQLISVDPFAPIAARHDWRLAVKAPMVRLQLSAAPSSAVRFTLWGTNAPGFGANNEGASAGFLGGFASAVIGSGASLAQELSAYHGPAWLTATMSGIAPHAPSLAEVDAFSAGTFFPIGVFNFTELRRTVGFWMPPTRCRVIVINLSPGALTFSASVVAGGIEHGGWTG